MKLTRAGALYIALTLLLGFAAVNTGNNLLYLLVSALLGFMAISGLLGQQNLQRLEVRFFPANELYAATASAVEVELLNRRKWLPAFLICVETDSTAAQFPVLAATVKQRRKISLTLPLRGYQSLPTVRITSRFPINFFVRSRHLQLEQQVLVFPRPLAGDLPAGATESRQNRQEDLAQMGADGGLRSIDNYREGDPLKSIHWKHSARHEDYKVKRLHRLGAPSLLLDFAELPGSVEEKLSRCTYLINHHARQQQAIGLRLPERSFSPAIGSAHRHKLLTELALYDRH